SRDHHRQRHRRLGLRPRSEARPMTSMNNVGRPTRPEAVQGNDYIHPTLTGARGLLQDEPLIFELGGWEKTGVDLPAADLDVSDLGDLVRSEPIGLPGLSEPE